MLFICCLVIPLFCGLVILVVLLLYVCLDVWLSWHVVISPIYMRVCVAV